MTRYYADGRPAGEPGAPIRYDAGGRPHMAATLQEAETGFAHSQAKDLGMQLVAIRSTVQDIQTIATAYANLPRSDRDEYSRRSTLAEYVLAFCEKALR